MKKSTVDYYKILGVDKNAGFAEIKKAYQYLVLTKHPDVNRSPNASAEFMAIIRAYNILRDETKRAAYDEQLQSEMSVFDKIGFRYARDKAARRSTGVFKKLAAFVQNIAPRSTADAASQSACDIPPEIKAMSLMPTAELEMRLSVSDNAFVRSYAAFALGVKCDRSAVGALENALSDPELSVRQKAVWAIGELKMKKSLPVLRTMYENSGSTIRQAITEAVYKITGGHGKFYKEITAGSKARTNQEKRRANVYLDGISAENKILNV